MKNRVDEIFSVERLRRVWKGGEAPVPLSPSNVSQEPQVQETFSAPSPVFLYARLREAIARRFPGGKASAALEPLLQELGERMERRFPAAAAPAPPPDEKAALDAVMEDLLNRIEDLVEALEIGSGR